jgi:hypothetical protein
MSVLVSLVIHVGGILDSRGTVQAARDRCTYIGHDGIVLGVTPPGAFRKMNEDNDCLFNANIIMNELTYDHVAYVYDNVHDYVRMIPCKFMFKNKSTRCYKTIIRHGIEEVKNMIPMTILGFP